MLRNFIRDRGTQLTLGTFVATFVYAVLVLVSIGPGAHGDFVPHIVDHRHAGAGGADLGVLIYFIHHTATSIQLPQVIASIARDLSGAIEPDSRGDGSRSRGRTGAGPVAAGADPPHGGVRRRASGHRRAATCSSSAWRRWSGIAAEADAVIRLQLPARPLRRARGIRSPPCGRPVPRPRSATLLGRSHITGPYRTLTQDVSFADRPARRDRHPRPLARGQRHLHRPDVHRLARRQPVQDHAALASGPCPPRQPRIRPGHHGPAELRPAGRSGRSRRSARRARACPP